MSAVNIFKLQAKCSQKEPYKKRDNKFQAVKLCLLMKVEMKGKNDQHQNI